MFHLHFFHELNILWFSDCLRGSTDCNKVSYSVLICLTAGCLQEKVSSNFHHNSISNTVLYIEKNIQICWSDLEWESKASVRSWHCNYFTYIMHSLLAICSMFTSICYVRFLNSFVVYSTVEFCKKPILSVFKIL